MRKSYQTKVKLVQAEQWQPGTPTEGIVERPAAEEGGQPVGEMYADGQETPAMTIKPGDYLVADDEAAMVTVYSEEEFLAKFEPVPELTPATQSFEVTGSAEYDLAQQGDGPSNAGDGVMGEVPQSVIAISATLNGQDFEKLANAISGVAAMHPDTLLIHGNAPREIVVQKGWTTDLVDLLDEKFPEQIKTWDITRQQTNHQLQADLVKKLKAKVYIIGAVIGGVATEQAYYQSFGVDNVNYIALE